MNPLLIRRRGMMMAQGGVVPPMPQDTYLSFVAKTRNSSVSMQKHGEPAAVSLEYTLDGDTWYPYTIGDVIQLPFVGSWVKFKGVNSVFGNGSAWNYFVMTGVIDAYGDLTSILNGIGGDYTPGAARAFIRLFDGCLSLRRAPDLPTVRLGNRQYYQTFNNCANLNYIKTYMKYTSANQCLNGWVVGVGGNGTFVCPQELTISYGASGIPNGWTRVDL